MDSRNEQRWGWFFPWAQWDMVRYAKDEMARLRQPGDEPDEMQDAIEAHVLDVVQRFSEEGHSGSSAAYAVGIIERVLRFQPISPLTGADDEWTHLGYNDHMAAQNKRCSYVFKRADGTAYDTQAVVHRWPDGTSTIGPDKDVTFPYVPSVEYVDVDENGQPTVLTARYASLPRIIEAANTLNMKWALTCEWPDGSETVEVVGDAAAKALGYAPPGGWDGEGDAQDATVDVPRIFKDGNQWCCLLGADLATGVAGFGDTPADACCQFGERWLAKQEQAQHDSHAADPQQSGG